MADPNRPLWQWSACELAEAIAARKVTAVEAVDSAVARMRATNGKINAVVDDLGEAALREAEAHDKSMSASGPIGPLHGVPVTIKENVEHTGVLVPRDHGERAHGRTFNPWNTTASAGGSSGGAAAAVMMGYGRSRTATTSVARCAFRPTPAARPR